MKKYLSLVLLIIPFIINGQNNHKDNTIEVVDTFFCITNKLVDNKKIEKIQYTRQLAENIGLSKQDIFMKGGSSKVHMDSVKYFVYDQNWDLVKTRVLKDIELENYEYENKKVNKTREDYNIKERTVNISGRSNEFQTGKINLKNNLPQDYLIRLGSDNDNIQILEKEKLFLNNSDIDFEFMVKLETGKHEYTITTSNSNGNSELIKVKTIGYELLESDFVKQSKNLRSKEIVLKKDSDINIEILGNNKLLKIRVGEVEANIPVPKVKNKIDKETLKKGRFVLELHNLGSGEVRICRIRVE